MVQKFFMGAMRLKMANFKGGNCLCYGTKIFHGGDATKNDNFQRGKVRVQGYKNFQHVIMSSCHIFEFWGGDATKNDNFQRRKVRVQGRKNFQHVIMSSCHIFEFWGGDPTKNDNFQT